MRQNAIVEVSIDRKDKKAIKRAKDKLMEQLSEQNVKLSVEPMVLLYQLMDRLEDSLTF